MAAHVFDASEPGMDSALNRSIGNPGPAAAAVPTEGPLFAAHPAVFNKMHDRQRVGAGPLIGLAVGAVVIGGLVFAMSRHNQAQTTGRHLASTASAPAIAAASPPPATAAPEEASAAAPAPRHLRIETAPSRPAPAARVIARPARHLARRDTSEAEATAPAVRTPAPQAVTPPAPLVVTPAAPAQAPAAQAPAPAAPAPATPAPSTAPAPAAPDASASGGQTAPQ